MAEPVRLVVWDLDETFWRGTVSEGGIREYVQAHHDTVIELARRGILSSVCSKNDPDEILPILNDFGIDEYFVFPSISWEPKGGRLAQLIEDVGLRPETVMFIDDNPGNRAEARAAVPGLQVEDETFIARMLEHPSFRGKDDRELTRLKQYRLLQTRARARRESSGSNEDFLRGSGIQVRIEYDVDAHVDRAIELVNRTQQLNFTKRRLPEDLREARTVLRRDLNAFDAQAGLIEVRDKYGDYGMVGFFLTYTQRSTLLEGASNSRLLHFCFSCRTLGMHIERWVYEYLGRPELQVVGEVLTDLNVRRPIDWVQLVDSFAAGAAPLPEVAPQIVLWGGCESHAVGVYLKPHTPRLDVFGNYAAGGCFVRIGSAALLLNACRNEPSVVAADAAALGLPLTMLAHDVIGNAAPGTLFVLNLSQDAGALYYLRHKTTRLAVHMEAREAPTMDLLTVSDEDLAAHLIEREGAYTPEQRQHVLAVRAHLKAHFEAFHNADEVTRLNLIRRIFEAAPQGAKFVLAVDHDEVRHEPGKLTPIPALTRWTAMLRELAAEYPYVALATFTEVIEDPRQIQLFGNHYDRGVYLRFARRVLELCGELEPKPARANRAPTEWLADFSSGEPAHLGVFKRGWSVEAGWAWSEGHLAILEFAGIDAQYDYSLKLRLAAVAGPDVTRAQRISVKANRCPIAQLICRAATDLEFFIPRTAAAAGALTVSFDLPDAIRPDTFMHNGDQRLLGVAVMAVELRPFQHAFAALAKAAAAAPSVA